MWSQEQLLQHKHSSIKRSFCANKVLACTMLSVSVDEKSERAVKEYTIENGPLLLLSSPLSGFRRSTSILPRYLQP